MRPIASWRATWRKVAENYVVGIEDDEVEALLRAADAVTIADLEALWG